MNNKTILFIDDEQDALDRLRYLFEDSFTCYYAATGESGLRLFNELNPALIVCDVKLPDYSGFDICREIKDSNRQHVLVLLSAYNDKAYRLKGLEAYADNYIDKSLEDRELFLRIRNLHPFFLPELPTSPTLTKNLKIDIKVAFENVYSVNGNNSHKATLQDIATLLNISPRSLQRKLTSELGVTFTQSHLSFRLERSKELLQQGYNSSDVATILAFASPSHFSSCFKKHFDVTPSAFLNSNELNQ